GAGGFGDRGQGVGGGGQGGDGLALLGGPGLVGRSGGAAPVGQVGAGRAGQVGDAVVQGRGDVAPGVGVRGDLGGVAGQPVRGLGQRLDVFDDPGDAVLQQGADRVGDERQGVQAGADPAQGGVDPGAAAHAVGDQFDVFGDPHPGPRI